MIALEEVESLLLIVVTVKQKSINLKKSVSAIGTQNAKHSPEVQGGKKLT